MNNRLLDVMSVVSVSTADVALAWYSAFLGEPTVAPDEDVYEWQIGSSWLQVSVDEKRAGSSTTVIGVDDLEAFITESTWIHDVQIQDFGFVRLAHVEDPDGNNVCFVQQLADEKVDAMEGIVSEVV